MGKILLMPCPGTSNVDIETSIQQLAEQKVRAILTLMPLPELEKWSASELPELCQKHDIAWMHLPIADDSVPEQDFFDAWLGNQNQVHALLAEQQTIAIHCKGGSGRTGLMAAQILLELGQDFDSTRIQIQALRPKALHNTAQVNYLKTVSAL